MNRYLVFLKKELFEASRTYKLLIMGAVFLIFGLMGPIIAKTTPEIIKMALAADPNVNDEIFSALLTAVPTARDSWTQFFSNVGQPGLIALVIVFGGTLSTEISKGTLTIVLTKGLSRSTVILSKFTSAFIIWTGSYLIAVLSSLYATAVLFEDMKLPYLFLALFCLWLFGVFLLALISLFASFAKKSYVCMLLIVAVAFGLSFVNMLPKVRKFNPITLTNCNVALLYEGGYDPNAVYPALIVTGVCIIALPIIATVIFKKRQI